ncbi:hypothetical protein N7517_004459 [Penicillium concentricum]|uniref:Uncharacterized protein n=1 Tax=Penicillium concentricum TaxID=293559 RepID=A0A9W9S5J8_9EURO|nr:uncharacterized protein N7517_004459 [Penicillium concentricum]KAJ5372453.1 hypothetical protein N7517_004459 [Penicillium concentricum]
METPARDALLRLACNQKKAIELDPNLERLKEAASSIRGALLKKFRRLDIAKMAGDERYQELRRLQAATKTHRKRLFEATRKKKRREFFEDIGNRIIEGNHEGNPITFNLDLSYMQPERRALTELEFKKRDTDGLDTAILIEDRIRSLELRLQLNELHVPGGLHKKLDFRNIERKLASVNIEETKETSSRYWKSQTGLEYPFCLGCSNLNPAARHYSYSRKDSLSRHFKTHQLPSFFAKPGRPCDIPSCATISVSLPGYLLHLNKCHKLWLYFW